MKIEFDDIFEEMCVSAVRYALGRRTYIVADTCNYMKPLLDKFSNRTLTVMYNDIARERDRGDDCLGDLCDKKEWLSLLDRIGAETNRRQVPKF